MVSIKLSIMVSIKLSIVMSIKTSIMGSSMVCIKFELSRCLVYPTIEINMYYSTNNWHISLAKFENMPTTNVIYTPTRPARYDRPTFGFDLNCQTLRLGTIGL